MTILILKWVVWIVFFFSLLPSSFWLWSRGCGFGCFNRWERKESFRRNDKQFWANSLSAVKGTALLLPCNQTFVVKYNWFIKTSEKPVVSKVMVCNFSSVESLPPKNYQRIHFQNTFTSKKGYCIFKTVFPLRFWLSRVRWTNL